MVSARPYSGLRVLLFTISAIEALVGLALVFATGWVVALVPVVGVFPASAFVETLLKGIGIVVIAYAYLLCAAARDPVRYVAVIDALAFLLIAAALLNIYAVVGLHLTVFYPGPYLIVRAIVQLILAAAVIALRPRVASQFQTAGPRSAALQ